MARDRARSAAPPCNTRVRVRKLRMTSPSPASRIGHMASLRENTAKNTKSAQTSCLRDVLTLGEGMGGTPTRCPEQVDRGGAQRAVGVGFGRSSSPTPLREIAEAACCPRATFGRAPLREPWIECECPRGVLAKAPHKGVGLPARDRSGTWVRPETRPSTSMDVRDAQAHVSSTLNLRALAILRLESPLKTSCACTFALRNIVLTSAVLYTVFRRTPPRQRQPH